MATGIWTYAKLTPEQERELKDVEKDVGGVLLAYTEAPVMPSELSQEQMRRLDDLQKQTGLVIVSVKPSQQQAAA